MISKGQCNNAVVIARNEAIFESRDQSDSDELLRLLSYQLTNTVIYTGVTNDLVRRITELREQPSGFVKRYSVWKLVYYEEFEDAYSAIGREKQIKGGSLAREVALIKSVNPMWRDLAPELL